MRRNIAIAGWLAFHVLKTAAMLAAAPLSIAWWIFHLHEVHPDARLGSIMLQLAMLAFWLLVVSGGYL